MIVINIVAPKNTNKNIIVKVIILSYNLSDVNLSLIIIPSFLKITINLFRLFLYSASNVFQYARFPTNSNLSLL